MCRWVQKLGVHRKKTWYSSQAATERVQKLRLEYWEKIKDIEPENKRIFGRNPDSTRCDQNSFPFTAGRVSQLKPFYRGPLIHSQWRN